MRFWKSALAVLLLSLAARSASAFTPESGLWWNPLEDGRGYAMEIQDNVIAILVYGYDNDTARTSAFFTAAGTMTGNAAFSGTLDGATNGQCLTCAYTGRPVILTGAGGAISIVFDSETRGRLTMGGRTFPIERFNFALGNPTQQMQGEWQIVLDLSTRPGNSTFQAYPFYGDVMTIDRVDLVPNPDQFRGCRPDTSLVGRCTANANANHDLAGFFDTVQAKHVIVLTDGAGSSQSNSVFFSYVVTAGPSQFDGVMQILIGSVPETPTRFYPVRGFRSASKNFVQTGVGPSSSDPKNLLEAVARPGLVESIGGIDRLPPGLTADEVKAQYGIDVDALQPRVQELIRSMQ